MISALFSIFASEDLHISLKPETIFEIKGIAVTNSMIYGALTAVILSWILIHFGKKVTVKPKRGMTALLELIMEFVISLLEGAFGNRKDAVKYAPVFGTFFIFVLFNNLMGILPVVGPGIAVGGIPVFRPYTADLNGTIALSVIAIIVVQVLSVRAQGSKGHLKHYFSDKPLNPINMFIGILEVFGEFTRILSLSLRLFLNTAVGEILIVVFTSLVLSGGRTPFAAIPIFLFEALVAGIQAYVFTVLIATYLALAISHAHDEHDHEPEAQKVEELTA